MGYCGTLTLLLALLAGCSDYTVTKVVERAPDIIVTPEAHDFGVLNAADAATDVPFLITNVGNDTLHINSNYLENGDPRFAILNSAVGSLEPSESAEIIVSYDPLTYEENSEFLVIKSNDEDDGTISIPLIGAGDAPVISLTPDLHDFGAEFVGCEEYVKLKIENVGNVDLEISLVDYYTSLPVDLTPSDYEAEYGPFPWLLAPSEARHIAVFYTPTDLDPDAGWLSVSSNDPLNPIVSSDQTGDGDYESVRSERFEQDGMLGSDILFVIDNSGSMCGNQTQLASNFDTFINILSASGYDYQIAFITTDSADFVGPIITPLTPDPIAEAASQITGIGCHGHAIEKGMDMSWNATMGAGDAAPGSEFLREDTKLVVIYLSDEDDFSTVSPGTMAGRLNSLKASSSMAVAHAVAGDVPGGCSTNGGAQAGNDYHDLVSLTGGTFLSICAEDWGTPMEELARESLALSVFYLEGDPVEDTIRVEINGVVNSDWTYDPALNAVVFSVIPDEGASIDIAYAEWACQGE